MNGYIKIHVIGDGFDAYVWQHVVDGSVVGHVTDAGDPIALPEIHEATVADVRLFYAPNVLTAP